MPAPKAWVCFYYYKQISNRLSDQETREENHKFYRKSLEDFYQTDIESFTYLSRVGNNRIFDGYMQAVQKVNYLENKVKSPAILEPVFEPFESRNGHKLFWMVLLFFMGSGIWLVMVLLAAFKEGEPHTLQPSQL